MKKIISLLLTGKKIHIIKLLSVFFLIAAVPLYSRDIDLDKIYIQESCPIYAKIIDKKIEAFKKGGAGFIDKNVAFAEWINGREIVYVKEQESINIIYLFDTIKHTRSEISRFDGTVTYFKLSQTGKFAVLKKFSIDADANTAAFMVVVKIYQKQVMLFKSNYLFADFTISRSGQSIFLEKKSGIFEFFPDSGFEKLVIKSREYEKIKSGDSNIFAYQSPDANKFAILCGQAGNYKAIIQGDQENKVIDNISSSTEFFWVDNNSIAYRKGGPGSFRSVIYNIKYDFEKILADDSFNTGLVYSNQAKAFSFLKGQLINFYFPAGAQIIQTGLEGEDSALSPDSTRFLSIFNRNLFIGNISVLDKKTLQVKKISAEILVLYNELLKLKKCWGNEFSNLYIKRKIAAYKNFLGK